MTGQGQHVTLMLALLHFQTMHTAHTFLDNNSVQIGLPRCLTCRAWLTLKSEAIGCTLVFCDFIPRIAGANLRIKKNTISGTMNELHVLKVA